MTGHTAVLLELDHLQYIKFRPYRRKVNAAVRRYAEEHRGEAARLTVAHEDNGSCCRREPWGDTFARLIEALGDDGLRTLGLSDYLPGQSP